MLLLTVAGPQAKHGFSGRDSKVAHPEISLFHSEAHTGNTRHSLSLLNQYNQIFAFAGAFG
jgi:hypothetical protein